MLEYGPARSASHEGNVSVDVVPRLGTISPWSSKATDIAHICGLEKVRRIERGLRYSLSIDEAALTDEALMTAIRALLHDRMTESVLDEAGDSAGLFEERQPAELATVDVMGGGIDALNEADRELGLALSQDCLLYTSPSPRDATLSRMPSSA